MEKKKSFFFANTGRMILTIVVIGIIITFALYKLPLLWSGIAKFIAIVKPFIYGAVIAYILMPCYNFFVRKMEHALNKSKFKKKYSLAKLVGILGCMLILLLICYCLIGIIIPQLAQSIINIAGTQTIAQNAQDMVNKILQKIEENPHIYDWALYIYNSIYDSIAQWVQNDLTKFSEDVIKSFSDGILGSINFFKNLGIGIIIAIYIFYGKEGFIKGFKKLLYSIFHIDTANRILDDLRMTDRIFGGFINGKLLDSLIIGIISFVVLGLIKMPYALLLSVIIGVTNIIPFFGPIIGAIPCAILLVLISPLKCVEFIIFAIVVQFVDGHFIGPQILGQSTGLSSFWVLFAILVFGGIFGFIGMIIGVPVFAVIYNFILRFVNNSLAKKGIPEEKIDYYNLKSLDTSLENTPEGGNTDAH